MKTDTYIPQAQLGHLKGLVQPGKAVLIYGPRRVGKTTLITHYAESADEAPLLVSGEDIAVRDYLESQSVQKLKSFVGRHKILVIDEAQHVKNVGLNLKLLVDHVPDLCIVATGSSSFALAHEAGAPLTGRQHTLNMFPLSVMELLTVEAPHELQARLESRLIYGMYPEVILAESNQSRELYLRELLSSYLFRDILQFDGLRGADKLTKLLQLLAFQVGKDVSLAELGGNLGMSKNTVGRYVGLLEKSFVIYERAGFSRNLRKEIAKSKRYYFYDNGIRNALISNFNPLSLRDDVGALWENFICCERIKRNVYTDCLTNSYFWRTYDQKEIDLVEETAGALAAFEMKWSPRSKTRVPGAWSRTYPDASFEVINSENYLPFIT